MIGLYIRALYQSYYAFQWLFFHSFNDEFIEIARKIIKGLAGYYS